MVSSSHWTRFLSSPPQEDVCHHCDRSRSVDFVRCFTTEEDRIRHGSGSERRSASARRSRGHGDIGEGTRSSVFGDGCRVAGLCEGRGYGEGRAEARSASLGISVCQYCVGECQCAVREGCAPGSRRGITPGGHRHCRGAGRQQTRVAGGGEADTRELRPESRNRAESAQRTQKRNSSESLGSGGDRR